MRIIRYAAGAVIVLALLYAIGLAVRNITDPPQTKPAASEKQLIPGEHAKTSEDIESMLKSIDASAPAGFKKLFTEPAIPAGSATPPTNRKSQDLQAPSPARPNNVKPRKENR